ncbi:hypothetical protein [Agathobaculum desmolans]|uniref:hypothetical protein n=1 Tax=Agathobaculum desmolans TaxID=39484 RepID=UPI00248E0580|nr:hypothetical protein [Agathobaculum desmolans]
MTENQQPLTEEEQTAPLSEEEQAALPAETDEAVPDELPEEEDALLSEEDAEGTEDEEEEDIDPADLRIFGMPRMCFHGAAFGVAGGYILAGLIGLIFHKEVSATICAIGCAVVGYWIGKHFNNKRLAARAVEEAAAQAAEAAAGVENTEA